MLRNQADAKKIMEADGKIWEEEGWQHGGMVNKEVLKSKLARRLRKKRFSPVVYEILEDANFHSSNNALKELGYIDYPKRNQLKKYRRLGGKTWDIWD